MLLASAFVRNAPVYGVLGPSLFFPATADVLGRWPSLKDLIADDALDVLKDRLEAGIDLETVILRQPIPNASKIICVGLNYRKPYPVDGVAPPDPEHIILFGKEQSSMVAHHEPLQPPSGMAGQSFDYEGEIAVVIGKPAFQISEETALDHVLGYSALNDGSVRNWQKHSIYAGKNFYHSGSWGPAILTKDALDDPDELRLKTFVNGELRQSCRAKEMVFSIAAQIAYISHLFPLEAGDVIATGSPDGTGGARNPKAFLRPGDLVEVQVGAQLSLKNRVARA